MVRPDGRTGFPVRLWDVERRVLGKQLEGHEGPTMAVSFSPDGKRLASTGWDGAVCLWETATGKQVWRYKPKDRMSLKSLAFSPDGRQVACVGYTNNIFLCDVATGKESHRIDGPQSALTAVAFSPDGKIIASAGMDGTVLLWDVASVTAQAVKPAETTLDGDVVERVWADLADEDSTRAHQAVWKLVAASPQAVGWLKGRLRPIKVDVKEIDRLIANLEHEQFAEREAAMNDLRKLGSLAEPLLRKAQLGKPAGEMQRRLKNMLQELDVRAPVPEHLRMLRAIEVLEHIATPQAREVLATLVLGADVSPGMQEAKAALERLSRRSTGAP
jgi:hypothetical protein